MKKLLATLLVATVALISSFSAKAIEDPFDKGTILAGVHFAGLPGVGTTVYGEYVLVDSWWMGHFSVGAQLGYNNQKQRTYDDKTVWLKVNHFDIMARANYGLNITDSFEVHAGLLMGVGIQSNKDYGSKAGFNFGGIAGLRYYFTPSLAGSFEMHYCPNINTLMPQRVSLSPILNIGVSFRF